MAVQFSWIIILSQKKIKATFHKYLKKDFLTIHHINYMNVIWFFAEEHLFPDSPLVEKVETK